MAREALAEAAGQLVGLSPRIGSGSDPARTHHELMGAVHGFLGAAHAAEAVGLSPAEMQDVAADARRLCGRTSPILAYTQRWPRGYAGDFELIERLIDGQPGGEPESDARLLDQIILNLPIVEQHRAKIAWQAACVRRRLDGRDRVRVLSIACGGARDLTLLEPAQLARLSVVLNDVDAGALALAGARLAPRVAALAAVEGNVLRRLTQLRALGPFEVIVVGGLLDYLPARPAAFLVRHLLRMLAPGGQLATTNIAAGNPWRLFLELLANWPLIHRDEPAMRALFAAAPAGCALTRDRTGLTWLGLAAAEA